MIPVAFDMRKLSAATSVLFRVRTSRATQIGSDTLQREGAPVVRRLIAEAAWQARRRSPTVCAYFERVQHGDPQRKKISLVATGHYLVRAMWAMLKRGTYWQENPGLHPEVRHGALRRRRCEWEQPHSGPGTLPGEGGRD